MSEVMTLPFDQADLLTHLAALSDEALDALDFGVIAIDADGLVRRYNSAESKLAGLAPGRVLGQPLFTVVAPCMNNFMVAQRFEDSAHAGTALDDCVPYVLTLRMRPTKVQLRLLAAPGAAHRYLLVRRPVAAS